MITIKHKKTGEPMDVTAEQWKSLQATSRNWEKIGEKADKPAVKYSRIKKQEEDPEEED